MQFVFFAVLKYQEKKVLEYILAFSVVITVSFGPCVGILLWVIPCMPPFPGTLILPCDPNGFLAQPMDLRVTSIMIIQSVFNAFIWTYLPMFAIFCVYCVFPIATMSISSFLSAITGYMVGRFIYILIASRFLNYLQRNPKMLTNQPFKSDFNYLQAYQANIWVSSIL